MNKTTTSTTPIETWYSRVGKLSVGVVLFLILVGGIVRSSGSGMGCPDWPTCFGLLVPPTEVSEIPQAFFESHPEFESQTFNVIQTWVEYINRLVGAFTGLIVFVTFLLSFAFWRKDKRVVVLSFLAIVMTGVEAWLGKLVVDQNLEGGMVTIHMFGAILITGLLITAVYLAVERDTRASRKLQASPPYLRWLGFAVVLLTVFQILLGTQVREMVDEVAVRSMGMNRGSWLEELGWEYALHRVLWIVLLGAAVVWAKGVMQHGKSDNMVRRLTMVMLSGFAGEVLLGIMLTSFDLPPVLQPLHLLFANIIFAVEFALLLNAFGVERIFAGRLYGEGGLDAGKVANAKH